MYKKIVSIGVLFVMVLSLTACQGVELAAYKNTAKTGLEAYAESKGEGNYTADNWAAIGGLVADGKDEIDAAANKPAVDTAVENAEQAIEDVPQKEEEMGIFEVEADDMVDCSHFEYSFTMSAIGAMLVLFHADENAVFECSVDNGQFGLQSSTNQNGQKVHDLFWSPGHYDAPIFEQAFVDIILKLDEQIIGYAVVEIYATAPSNMGFKARNLKSAIFPKVDGEYQNITENQVKSIIEKIKGVVKEKIYESWWDGKAEVTIFFPREVEQGEAFEIKVITKNLLTEDLVREVSGSCCAGKGILITAIKLQSDDNYGLYHEHFFVQDGAEVTDIILAGEQVEAIWAFEGKSCTNSGYITGAAIRGIYDIYLSNGEVFRNAITIH